MKKLTLGFMAFALAAATLFSTSCKDDDDEEDSKISELSASVKDGKFSTSTAGFYSSKSSSEAGTSKLANIFGSSENGTTTIMGTKDGKQLAINIKGTTSGTYDLSIAKNTNVNQALIDLLSGKDYKDIIADAVDVETDAMIIYRASGESEGGATYYFSTEASVTFNLLAVYATGTFTATMRNQAGDTFTISDGSFKVFGKPVTAK